MSISVLFYRLDSTLLFYNLSARHTELQVTPGCVPSELRVKTPLYPLYIVKQKTTDNIHINNIIKEN